MLISNSIFVDFVLTIIVSIYLFYKYATRNFDYWKKKGVPYLKPTPFFGNFFEIFLFKDTIGEVFRKLYNQSPHPFFGIYAFDRPCLMIKGPDLLRSVLVKDFDTFTNRTILSSPHDILTKHYLFVSRNPEWKSTRVKLTPFFSSGKIKMMMPHTTKIADRMVEYVAERLVNGKCDLEAKNLCAKFTTDVIAICAFGINAHCLDKENAEFFKAGRIFFDFNLKNAVSQMTYFFMPSLASACRFKFFDQTATDFMKNILLETVKQREISGAKCNDLIDIVVELKKDQEYCRLNEFFGDVVASQPVQFFAAGFETTSSLMSFTLYEFCIQPDIQEKARNDVRVNIAKYGGITYEAIQNMKYIHMCAYETLRKYPVLPFLDRECARDYTIPDTDVVIEEGTPVYIPLFGLHLDPQYFPDPYRYDPERFAENARNYPFIYFPFGEGPRSCIGERFGLLNAKIGLVYILNNFKLEINDKTPLKLEFNPKNFLLTSKVGLPMRFVKL